MTSPRRSIVLVVAAVLVLGGCSSGGKAAPVTGGRTSGNPPVSVSSASVPSLPSGSLPSGSVPSVSLPSASAGSGPVPVGSDGSVLDGRIEDLLPALPIPPGLQRVSASRLGGQILAEFMTTDDAGTYAFWKDRLPGAGFTVGETDFAGSAGSIAFTGHGCTGSSNINIYVQLVAVECDLQ